MWNLGEVNFCPGELFLKLLAIKILVKRLTIV